MSADDLGCQRNNGDTCYLTDIRHRTGGTWIYLDDIYILAVYNKLDIDHSLYMKGSCQLGCVVHNGFHIFLCNILCRVNRDTVAGMDTGTLDMLHDAGDQDVCTVTDSVYLNLLTHDIFVYQDRMLLSNLVDDADKFINILIIDGNLHSLSAKHIGGTDQNWIAQLMSSLFCLLGSKYRMASRSRDTALLQDGVKAFSILSRVYILSRCSKDRNAHFHQGFCELDGCLSAKLNHCSVWLFNINNALHIFRCQRLKIQLIRNIKVRTYGFRVIVDNDGLIAFFAECPGAVYGTEVELDSLSDTDGTGA